MRQAPPKKPTKQQNRGQQEAGRRGTEENKKFSFSAPHSNHRLVRRASCTSAMGQLGRPSIDGPEIPSGPSGKSTSPPASAASVTDGDIGASIRQDEGEDRNFPVLFACHAEPIHDALGLPRPWKNTISAPAAWWWDQRSMVTDTRLDNADDEYDYTPVGPNPCIRLTA